MISKSNHKVCFKSIQFNLFQFHIAIFKDVKPKQYELHLYVKP